MSYLPQLSSDISRMIGGHRMVELVTKTTVTMGMQEMMEDFPSVSPRDIRCHQCGTEPREKELLDRISVKWCSLCSFWGNHLKAGHTATNAMDPDVG